MAIDIDLNLEPVEQPIGTFRNEVVDFTHDSIKLRFVKLAGVAARSRQLQGRRSSETRFVSEEMNVDMVADEKVGNVAEKGVGYKRANTHLVAEALKLNAKAIKVEKGGGESFFDCNVCLGMAREPILTCCGHLYCWSCFYYLPDVDSTSKECPACKGEVKDGDVVPIYGSSHGKGGAEPNVPPRPKAVRVESSRTQHLAVSVSQVPVAYAVDRIRRALGAMGDHRWQQQVPRSTSLELQNSEAFSNVRPRSRRIRRLSTNDADLFS